MKKSIIILDTETTDTPKPEETNLDFQPHMTEIFCLKVSSDKKMKVIDSFHSLVKPFDSTGNVVPVPGFITKITGIDDYTLKKAPSFLKISNKLIKFFLGCEVMVAHNLSFDLNIIRYELQRIGKEFNFPYPMIHHCTVEISRHVKGYRLKNNELYEFAKGKPFEGSHRAKADVMATFSNYKWLLKQKRKK